MLGDELIITLSIDFIALALQLYLINKDTPIYLDALITIFLVIFNFASYLNGVVYVAGENETKVNNSTVLITYVYKPDPFAPLFMIGFALTIVSGFLIIIKMFTKKGNFDLFS
ncbi:hypothetical protein AVT98_gp10 [Sulfolobales virus YNP1]|uniref:hypothetical protein n=1 Tax=Sulfolobales virus YNP1 TaxID=1732179 RepID=UPI00070667B6|nr:hypothetical protein AVT98_gp10 [Sulfolobales virus YNP1]ALG97102.1 hypothetical protein [Sulfolobales virus YNP1]